MNHILPRFQIAFTLVVLVCALAVYNATGQVNYTPYTFTTILGSAGSTGSMNGTNGAAQFFFPRGITVDTNGNLYIADSRNNKVRKASISGTNWVVTTLNGTFNSPLGVAVDTSENVYVADSGNDRIQKITASGTVSTLAGKAGVAGHKDGPPSVATFNGPESLAVDSSGNVYVADTFNSTIRLVTPSGTVSTLAGSALNSGTNDGLGTNQAQFFDPQGITLDTGGNLYVADTLNNTIRKITNGPSGWVVSTLAGSPGNAGYSDGASDAQFDGPASIGVDVSTNLYIADTGNDTVREVTPSGVVTTLAGIPGSIGSTDGQGNGALFNNPGGIAVASQGGIFVSDTHNDTIRADLYVLGVDVSHHNNDATNTGVIDFATAASAGRSFVFVKLTQGNNYTDPEGDDNIQGATKAGILVAPYHLCGNGLATVASPIVLGDPTAEAQYFLSQASAYIGNGYLPPALDVEATFDGTQAVYSQLTGMTLSQWVTIWLQFVQLKTGVTPIIYANYSVLPLLQGINYPLWIATVDNNITGVPAHGSSSWTNWQFKQYASDISPIPGHCPGIPDAMGIGGVLAVDLDSFNGYFTQLMTLTNYPPIVLFSGIGWTPLPPPTGGQFAFQVFSPTLQSATVQVSQDLATWTDVGTVTIGANRVGYFYDSNLGAAVMRVYRIKY